VEVVRAFEAQGIELVSLREHIDTSTVHMQSLHAQRYAYHAIADTLNTAGVLAIRGGCWRANTVRQILLRMIPHQQRRVAYRLRKDFSPQSGW
jgi:hypothetical protein